MSATNTPCGFIDPAKFRRLMREYDRTNPHNLPELRRPVRKRVARRTIEPERVYTTRYIAIA
jgi:hypothetical protein